MKLWNSIVLTMSGGLIVASIILSQVGLDRSALSRRAASLIAGIGTGVGGGMFIFYGVSNGDYVGSIITGTIVAIIVGLSFLIPNR
jgi:hypothetical protein